MAAGSVCCCLRVRRLHELQHHIRTRCRSLAAGRFPRPQTHGNEILPRCVYRDVPRLLHRADQFFLFAKHPHRQPDDANGVDDHRQPGELSGALAPATREFQDRRSAAGAGGTADAVAVFPVSARARPAVGHATRRLQRHNRPVRLDGPRQHQPAFAVGRGGLSRQVRRSDAAAAAALLARPGILEF